MIAARVLAGVALAAVIGPCESPATTDAPERGGREPAAIDRSEAPAPEALDCEPQACSMVGLDCPSLMLPRVEAQLDAAGWARLGELAEQRMVALALGDGTARIVEGCRIPGRYHEVAAAPDSPGRGWAADRLVFTPDEPSGCAGATHFVASFALRERTTGAEGAAIALPLPCPPADVGVPDYCIAAGLDADARDRRVRADWEQVDVMLRRGDGEGVQAALALLVDLAALRPDAITYANVVRQLRTLDDGYGGCLWRSEAEYAARALDPEFEVRVDLSSGRLTPSHEGLDCATRPSLMTCLPADQFVPGVGGNCW